MDDSNQKNSHVRVVQGGNYIGCSLDLDSRKLRAELYGSL